MPQNTQPRNGPFASQGWLAHAPSDWPVIETGDGRLDYQVRRAGEFAFRAVQIASWCADAIVEWDEFLSYRINSACSLAEKTQYARMRALFRGLFDGSERPSSRS